MLISLWSQLTREASSIGIIVPFQCMTVHEVLCLFWADSQSFVFFILLASPGLDEYAIAKKQEKKETNRENETNKERIA